MGKGTGKSRFLYKKCTNPKCLSRPIKVIRFGDAASTTCALCGSPMEKIKEKEYSKARGYDKTIVWLNDMDQEQGK